MATSSDALDSFRAFMNVRERAAAAYIRGDYGPLSEIVAQAEPASFYGPGGGSTQGTQEVNARYERDARSFASGSSGQFEVLHMEASGDLAYWVGLQHASAQLAGKEDKVPFHLRITEIFRREGSTWKLVHRHADPLVEAEPKPPRS